MREHFLSGLFYNFVSMDRKLNASYILLYLFKPRTSHILVMLVVVGISAELMLSCTKMDFKMAAFLARRRDRCHVMWNVWCIFHKPAQRFLIANSIQLPFTPIHNSAFIFVAYIETKQCDNVTLQAAHFRANKSDTYLW